MISFRLVDVRAHRASLTLAILVACATVAAKTLPNPERLGPYPVGVATMQLDDSTRLDPELKAARPLLTEIWYPAVDNARSMSKNRYSDFLPREGGITPPYALEAENQRLDGY